MSTDNLNTRVGHFSRNSLQMVASLVRIEARNVKRAKDGEIEYCPIEQLADRLDTIILTHKQIDPDGMDVTVQLDSCIRAVIALRAVGSEQQGQIIYTLCPVTLSLDKAVPAMLLMTELLSVIEDGARNALSIRNISLQNTPNEAVNIILQFNAEIAQFDDVIDTQVISLLTRQLRANLSCRGKQIHIYFN